MRRSLILLAAALSNGHRHGGRIRRRAGAETRTGTLGRRPDGDGYERQAGRQFLQLRQRQVAGEDRDSGRPQQHRHGPDPAHPLRKAHEGYGRRAPGQALCRAVGRREEAARSLRGVRRHRQDRSRRPEAGQGRPRRHRQDQGPDRRRARHGVDQAERPERVQHAHRRRPEGSERLFGRADAGRPGHARPRLLPARRSGAGRRPRCLQEVSRRDADAVGGAGRRQAGAGGL